MRIGILLRQRTHALDDASIDGGGVEEHQMAAGARLILALEALSAGEIDVEIRPGARWRRQRQRGCPFLERARHPLDLIRREVAAVQAHEQERANVFLFQRFSGLAERGGAERKRLALPAAHARELVELVQLTPLRGYPVAVAKQPEFAVDGFVMREPDQYARQDRFPPLLLAGCVSGLQRGLI